MRGSTTMKKEAFRRCGNGSILPLHRGRCLLLIPIWVFLFLLPACLLHAKWNLVFTQPARHGFRAGFFFDEENGFIAGRMDDGVYKTTDGGQTWVVTPIPLTPAIGTKNYVTQILMTDALHGWLTCEPYYTSPASCLLYTSDAADDLLCVDLGGRR